MGPGSASNNSNNTAVGKEALLAVTTGSGNTAVGLQAGDSVTDGTYNVLIGYQSGTEANNFSTGDECTMIGSFTDASGTNGQNQIVIGYDATGQADDSVTLGNTSVTDVYMASDSGAKVYCGDIDVRGKSEISNATSAKSHTAEIVKYVTVGTSATLVATIDSSQPIWSRGIVTIDAVGSTGGNVPSSLMEKVQIKWDGGTTITVDSTGYSVATNSMVLSFTSDTSGVYVKLACGNASTYTLVNIKVLGFSTADDNKEGIITLT